MGKYLLVLTLICSLVFKAKSTHIVGGELTYEFLSTTGTTNDYRITMRVYRDCFGGQADFDSPANVTVYEAGTLSTIFLDLDVFHDVPITNIPPVTNNPCLLPPANVCVEEAVYTTVITLPISPNGYYISYQRCCRNGTINNIIAPGTVGATYSVFISGDAMTSQNSSPVYNDFPPIVICAGDPLVFDHSASDANGNTLVYSLCAPIIGASQANPSPAFADPPPYNNVNYLPAFNALNPVTSNPTVNIDSNTGLITGTPIAIGQYVVGVCVSEFNASGVFIGEIQRDFQFNVTSCVQVINADIQEDSISAAGSFIINDCDNNVVTFINQSNDVNFIDAYYWYFELLNGDSLTSTATNPTLTFPDTGLYVGILVVNPGQPDCTDTAQISVFIHPPRDADFTFVIDSCNNTAPIQFFDASTVVGSGSPIASWQWDINSQQQTTQNITYLPPNAGTFSIDLEITDNNGCTDTQAANFEWYPAANIDIDVPDPIGCVPHTVNFVNNSAPFAPNYTTVWEFGDGNSSTGTSPTHIYTDTGTYTVTVVVTSPWGCISSDTLVDIVRVNDIPTPQFTSSFDSCVIGPVTFTDLSTPVNVATPIVSWFWEFDNGDTSNIQSPVYQYDSTMAGSYNVSLTVTDINGCSATFTDNVDWFPAPIIDVDVSSAIGCDTITIDFTNNSYPINGYSTVWDFGDNTTSLLASPSHFYTQPGIYPVFLTITSPTGCIETFTDTIAIFESPNASFSFFADSCAVDSVYFTNLSTTNSANDALVSWFWEFDDGMTSSSPTTGHLYDTAGTYNVSLTVTDINGCSSTETQIVEWYPAPLINFALVPDEGCADLTIDFSGITSPAIPNDYGILWEFGDGNTSTINYPVYTYTQDGTYTIVLNIISPNGLCTSSDSVTVTVHQRPEAEFSFGSDTCVIGPVSFIDASTHAFDTIVAWNWDFGDGNSSSSQNPVYQYANPGMYTIELTVFDSYGCTDSSSLSLNYFPAPPLSITPDDSTGCAPHSVTYMFDTDTFDVTGYDINWDFGDGGTSTDNSPTHTYNIPGTYVVEFSVTAPITGCIARVLDTIVVFNLPVANFEYAYDPCTVSSVSFTDLSTSQDGTVNNWTWAFNESDTLYSQNPIFQFDSSGTYNVTLLVTDDNGCINQTTNSVVWEPLPIYPVELGFQEGCVPFTASYDLLPYPLANYQLNWTFGDGATSNDDPVDHLYNDVGLYPVELTITSDSGCVETFSNQVNVLPLPIPDFFWTPESPSNIEPEVTFNNTSTDAAISYWEFGSGDVSFETNPIYTYPDTGLYNVLLTATHANGCVDSIQKVIDIVPKFTYYLPNAFTPNSDGINDNYFGTGITDKIRSFNMSIWNRWGEQVFETGNPSEVWNGRKNNTGNFCKAGVYVVLVKIVGGRGEQAEYKGFATIIY